LGCPKNLVHSEELLGRLGEEGFPIALAAELADVIVVNTCAFVADAVAETEETLLECLAYRDSGEGPSCVLAVGCLPLRGLPLPVLKRVDGLFGAGDYPELIAYLRGEAPPPAKPILRDEDAPVGRFRLGPDHFAYVRVTEGCDNRCAYCTIPNIRGPLRSRSLASVVAEAAQLATAGVDEIALVGQDVASYGRDRPGAPTLADLLEALEEVQGLHCWIRALYLHPAYLGEDVIEAASRGGKVLPYFDVPIQHADDAVLKSMNRRSTGEDLRRLIDTIRNRAPDAVLRTTVIAGLPGETPQAFEGLLTFLKWARFDRLGVFVYSPEEGTVAATLPGQVEEEERRRRADEILVMARDMAQQRNREMKGRLFSVVVDGMLPDGTYAARSWREAFEIDPVIVVSGPDLAPGLRGRVEIVGSKEADLLGRWTSEEL
jgi:ribosomal protein S12 methylthiotransferase